MTLTKETAEFEQKRQFSVDHILETHDTASVIYKCIDRQQSM